MDDRAEPLPFSRLELYNFKSYKNETTIEWKYMLSAIFGYNGSGKSSIVDAIEYAFCFNKYKLSAKVLEPILSVRGDNGRDRSSTWVRVKLNVNGEEKVFQRSTLYTKFVHKYSINGLDMTEQEYKSNLLKFNVNFKANNFLVQQHTIESIAMRDMKSRCEFFENLSNSISHKEEYVRLCKEINFLQQVLHQFNKDLKFHSLQEKKLTKKSNELQKYDELQKEIDETELDYYFAKFYQIDITIDRLTKEKNDLQKKANKAQEIKDSTEIKISELKQRLAKYKEQLRIQLRNSNKSQAEVSKLSLDLAKYQKKLLNYEKETSQVSNNLNKTRKKDEVRKKDLENLHQQYKEVEITKENFLITESHMSLITLNQEQYKDYLELKLKAQEKLAKDTSFLESYEREKNVIIDKINCFNMRIKSLHETIERHKSHYKELQESSERIRKNIIQTQVDMKKCQDDGNALESEIKHLEGEERKLVMRIQELGETIQEMKESTKNDQKEQRAKEVLERLKSCFSGVRGRLFSLCTFLGDLSDIFLENDIAITKVMGKNMDFIVVDTKDTARNCITFIKKQYAGSKYSVTEYFWPLDGVEPKSLDAARQKIINETHAVLAVDTIGAKGDDKEIDKLLRHILRDTVICATDELAKKISTEKNLDCVSVEGTLYSRNGIVSGGLKDLKEKAKKWKRKSLDDLINLKLKETAALRDLQKQISKKKESILILTTTVGGLAKRLEKYLEPMFEDYKKRLEEEMQYMQKLELEREDLEKNYDQVQLQEKLIEINNRIENLKIQKNSLEDAIFRDFCNHVGIDNVRQYEQGDLRKHKELSDRREEFDNHLDKISKQIELEESLDIKKTIEKLENRLNELQSCKENVKKEIDILEAKINEIKTNSEEQSDLKLLKSDLEAEKKELESKKLELSCMEKDLSNWNREILPYNTRILKLQSEKDQLLVNCKVNNIYIPLESTDTESSSQESVSESREKNVQIDYSNWPDDINNFNDNDLNNKIVCLKRKLDNSRERLETFQIDQKSKENLVIVKNKVKDLQEEIKNTLKELKNKTKDFEKIKRKRSDLFNKYFGSVAEKLDYIFKTLYENKSAQAIILTRNNEEPYLDGVDFNCVIPNKKIDSMENLSGGEKTMCALALLLAVYSVKPAPFLIFDEIDAALDNSSIKKISNVFIEYKSSTQVIFISHKEPLVECADRLVGVNFSPYLGSSHVIHIDLREYSKNV